MPKLTITAYTERGTFQSKPVECTLTELGAMKDAIQQCAKDECNYFTFETNLGHITIGEQLLKTTVFETIVEDD